MNRDGIYNLCNAIILQACTDYVSGQYKTGPLENFFYSSWYSMLSRERIDPDLLIRHLREERDNGKTKRIHKEHAQVHNGMR